MGNDLIIPESASSMSSVAAYGQYRVDDSVPTLPWFQDDAGSDGIFTEYEDGTWTPTLLDASLNPSEGQTYGTNNARYTKIGRLVNLVVDFRVEKIGSLTGTDQSYIGGLPFAPNEIIGGGGVAFQSDFLDAAGHDSRIHIMALEATNVLTVTKWDAATGSTYLTIDDWDLTILSTPGARLIFSAHYIT